MDQLQVKTTAEVEAVFDNYPAAAREKILNLRRLILETADGIDSLSELEETLKWGEPSYLAKKGSTIRIDWKEKQPDQYAMYFQCTSQLVPTFKALFPQLFQFEGNRAIVFQMNDKLPEMELKSCIAAGLTYHQVKHLPMLGM